MNRQQGMTLVELVISIVIIGIAAAALYSAMAAITGRSADPLLRQQSLAIAEAYLEEILLQPFLDPATGSQCPSPPASRAAFDNVCDYAGLADEALQRPRQHRADHHRDDTGDGNHHDQLDQREPCAR